MKHASLLALASMAMVAHAQPGWVLSHQKISDTQGGFTGILGNRDVFGSSAASLGDLDSDGVDDLGVGVPGDDDGGTVWMLFLDGVTSCYADCDQSTGAGVLDLFDFLCF